MLKETDGSVKIPGLFEAIQPQLGLRLAPVETAVPAVQIDSITRPTAD